MLWYGLVFGFHFVFFLLCYGLYRLKLRILAKLSVQYEDEEQESSYQQWDDFGEEDNSVVN